MSTAIKDYIDLLGCDTARISRPLGKLFLIIGWNRHTKDDNAAKWFRNGEPFDFPYVEERCVASGDTAKELWASAKEYKRLSGLTMSEFLTESAKRRPLYSCI